MSNIYKSTQWQQKDKRLISTKPITSLTSSEKEELALDSKEEHSEIDNTQDLEEKKKNLLLEIETLEARFAQLQVEIGQEKEKAEQEIASWWQRKQEEGEQIIEQMKEQAIQDGYQEGYNHGYQEIESQLQIKLEELEHTIASAYEEKRKIIEEAEPFLLSLSIKIAEKIIHQELVLDKDQLLSMIRNALLQVREKDEIIIQVSPENYETLFPHREELQLYVQSDTELKIILDRTMIGKGCVIHTSSGSYDVTIDSQLTEIKKHLISLYEERVGQ